MADTVSRSWFAVFPNPEQHGYEGSPEDIIEKLKQEWIGSNPLRKGWWGYCISEKGLPHVHMVLEDTGSCRFTKVKKAYTVAIVIVSRFGMRYILRVYFRQRISMLELLVEKTREKTLLNSFLDELQNMYIIIRSGMSIKLMSLQEISILILMI